MGSITDANAIAWAAAAGQVFKGWTDDDWLINELLKRQDVSF